MRALNIRWLGNLPYTEALTLQKGFHNSVSDIENEEDYLLLLEHNSVITLGRSGNKKNLITNKNKLDELGIEYFETDRGGDITYHGKGQLIGYPIIRLSDPKKVLPFVRSIENSIIDVLSKLNIDSYSKDGDTGVWTEKGKIASIGIKVSKWTTYHGFSLNISEELSGFYLINTCGNSNEEIAAVHQFNKEVSFKEIVEEVSDEFINKFNYEIVNKQFSQFTPTQLKSDKNYEIDEMVERGVFNKNKNSIPVTIKGLLPGEPKRPEWMKVKANLGSEYIELKNLITEKKLNTECEEASCPNIYECWSMGTATFMIMGDICTRACGFCDVNTGRPSNLDELEPRRVAESVKTMKLTHAVITSVNRDDLDDGGSSFFARTIEEIKLMNPGTSVEVLIPDFKGDRQAIDNIIEENPEVLNHNLETVPRLQREIRTAASYGRSLSLLQYAKEVNFMGKTKTGLIVGMGEEFEEVVSVLKDLSQINIDIVTIGQYLRPTPKHRPIHRYVTKEEFAEYKLIGEKFGIPHIESGPLVRSSYHAKDSFASV